MKKLVVFLFVILLGSQMISAQVRACVTFDKSRNLEGFKQVILTWKDPFIKSELWPSYVSLINESLKEKGVTIPVSLKGITFILDHTQEYENSYFVQSDYFNGVRIGNKLEYRNVAGNPSNWAVFVYDNVVCMYAKIGCCNPQKSKQPQIELQLNKKVEPLNQKPSSSQVDTIRKKIVYIEEEETNNRQQVVYVNNSSPMNYYVQQAYGGYYGYVNYGYYGGVNYNYYCNNREYTGNHHQYTGGHVSTGHSYQNTGQGHMSTGRSDQYTGGHGSTGRGDQNTGQGHMSGGRGQDTGGGYGNTGGGRSNVSSSYGGGRGR